MKFIKRITWGMTALLVMGTLVQTAPAPERPKDFELSAPAAGTANNACYRYTKKEKQFASKMNGARRNNNRSAMRLDPELSKVAFKHTQEMIKRNLLHHTDTNALIRRVTNWSFLGENVGVGGTVSSLHTAFMNSPSHKENIMEPSFKYVGVGTKQVGDKLWVTVVFEATSNPGTTLRMPRC